MTDQPTVRVTLPADVAQVDQTGYVWTFLDRAAEPDRVVPGVLIVAGDEEEPFLARVVDIVEGPGERQIVHLDVVGAPNRPSKSSGTRACWPADGVLVTGSGRTHSVVADARGKPAADSLAGFSRDRRGIEPP